MMSTEGLLRQGVLLLQDVRGDFDQEAVEAALVPLGEDGAHFGGLEAEKPLHEGVGLADHLHVAVLDSVVDHLDVVARLAPADVGRAGHPADGRLAGGRAADRLARLLVDLGRDRIPDRLQLEPGRELAARHE